MTFALMLFASFFAGFVDAIVGGGGLIQLPALLVLYPETEPAVLFGTNKLASFSGTTLAVLRYIRRVPVHLPSLAPAAAVAYAASLAGASLVTRLPSSFMRPLALVLLIGVVIYTFWKKDLGLQGRSDGKIPLFIAIGSGSIIGFYDGFFGPGTGSFLVFSFVTLAGLDFMGASVAAKVVNLATNLAALCIFLPQGKVSWELGLAMAACNMSGSYLGTRLALQHGASLIRGLFLVVVLGFVAKMAWDLSH
ncbi:MAG TPA: TSUP family transporter [Myxococcota bacterium]|nr:TSUP family transporter [Myxococcota bacterium]